MTTRKVYFNGNAVKLCDKDYVATGGEGAVWKVGDIAYKIWSDKSRAASLHDKIALLSSIRHKSLVVPLGCLFDQSGDAVGMAMPWSNGVALPKMFANGWRTDNAFGEKETEVFVAAMRDAMIFLHGKGALAPDANEFNWLSDGLTPKLIDADSWQIGKYPATAIMPSIDDPLRQGKFTEMSDWFSWAVVTFQLWTGIHPFKGKHPDFKPGEMVGRMSSGVSVFDKKTRLPPSVRDFSDIPKSLLDWYMAVFSNKERSVPPLDFRTMVKLSKKIRRDVSMGKASLSFIKDLPSQVLSISPSGLLFVKSGFWLDPQSGIRLFAPREAELIREEPGWVAYDSTSGELCAKVFDLSGREIFSDSSGIPCEKTFSNGVSAFAVLSKGIAQVKMTEKTSAGWTIRIGKMWDIPPSKVVPFSGGALLDAFGKAFVLISRGESLRLVKLPALDGKPVISSIVRGDYGRFVTKTEFGIGALSVDFSSDIPVATDDGTSLELIVLHNGMKIELPEDGVLRLSLNGKTRELEESAISSDWRFIQLPTGLGVVVDDRLYKLSIAQ